MRTHLKFALTIFTLLLSLNAQAANEDFRLAISVMPNSDLKFYCPTDVGIDDLDKIRAEQARRAGGFLAFAACVVTAPACIVGGYLGGLVYIAYKASTDNTGEAIAAAPSTCAQAPSHIPQNQRVLWRVTCEKVAYNANLDALENATSTDRPLKAPPYQLGDDITSWSQNGQTYKRTISILQTQNRLRDENFTSCISEPQTRDALEQAPQLTLGETVDLLTGNISRHGTRVFQARAQQRPRDLKDSNLKAQAQIFLSALNAGRFADYGNGFNERIKLDDWQSKTPRSSDWTVRPERNERIALATMAWSWSIHQEQQSRFSKYYYMSDMQAWAEQLTQP